MPKPLTLFVAMPGTSLGEHATWTDPDEIKEHFYEPLALKLGEKLGREVELVIEKDKDALGVIYSSMYGEAMTAEVYIADLTGANPNVYLELGVRWALRDNVTVPVCQDLKHDAWFNVVANRAIQYGQKPSELGKAIQKIIAAIAKGLEQQHVDSPVRDRAELIALPRKEIDDMRARIAELEAAQGDGLFKAAMREPLLDDRVRLLEQVIQASPARADAHGEIGIAYWEKGQYDKAVDHLTTATGHAPESARWWRELGTAQSRRGNLDAAIVSLTRAVTLDPNDGDAHAGLGGVYRRKARATGDRAALYSARTAYKEAARINKNENTYAKANVARLEVLLADDEDTAEKAFAEFRRLHTLARHLTDEEPTNWGLLDLAETWAFLGETEEAVKAGLAGLAASDPAARASTARTALEPVRDMIAVGWLTDEVVTALRALAVEYEKASAT